MQKLKNILYDKNDILVALIIVCVAGVIIFNRIETIMDFPSSLAADAGTKVSEPTKVGNDNNNNSQDKSKDSSKTNTEENKDTDKNKSGDSSKTNPGNTDKGKVTNLSVYIAPGASASDIANIFLTAKLVKDKQEILTAISTAGAESKLKAGTFIVPSNSTPAEIVAIITK